MVATRRPVSRNRRSSTPSRPGRSASGVAGRTPAGLGRSKSIQGACGEIGGGRAGVEQGMALAGHDAGDQVEEAVAPQEGGQRVAGVEAGFVFASRFTGDSCVAIFERAFDRLRATGIAELVRHAEFLEALDDYDIVLTGPPGRAE